MNTKPMSARRLVALVVAACCTCVLALALAGCGQQSAKDAETSIREGIDKDMQTLSSLDSGKASQLFSSDFTKQLTDAGIDPVEVYGPLFANLSYTIDGVDVDMDNSTAVAHLTITNKDMATAFSNYQTRLTDELSSEEGRTTFSSMTGDDAAFLTYMTSTLKDALSDSALTDVTSKVDVTYTLSNGAWVATDLTGLETALLGGLDETTLSAGATTADAAASSQDQAA